MGMIMPDVGMNVKAMSGRLPYTEVKCLMLPAAIALAPCAEPGVKAVARRVRAKRGALASESTGQRLIAAGILL